MAAFFEARLEPENGDASFLHAPESKIDVKLGDETRTGTVRGFVTDLSGKPVAEAVIQLAKNRLEPVAGCLTCQDGSFVLRDIPARTQYWLYAGRKGFKVYDSPPFFLLENQEIVRHIQLCPEELNHPACLAGNITIGNGQAATLSAVLVFRLAGMALDYHSLNFCDESGRYLVTNLEPGSYLLRVISECYPPVIQSLRIGPRDKLVRLDFDLSNPCARR